MQLLERFGEAIPELEDLYARATRVIKEHCPHRLSKKITLANLGLNNATTQIMINDLNGTAN